MQHPGDLHHNCRSGIFHFYHQAFQLIQPTKWQQLLKGRPLNKYVLLHLGLWKELCWFIINWVLKYRLGRRWFFKQDTVTTQQGQYHCYCGKISTRHLMLMLHQQEIQSNQSSSRSLTRRPQAIKHHKKQHCSLTNKYFLTKFQYSQKCVSGINCSQPVCVFKIH